MRPSPGPLFVPACAAWAGAAASEACTWECYRGAFGYSMPVAVTVACALGAVALMWVSRVRPAARAAAMVAVAFGCAFAGGTLSWHAWHADASDRSSDAGPFELVLASDPAQRDWGYVSSAWFTAGRHKVHLRVKWPDGEDLPGTGHVVEVQGSLIRADDSDSGRWNHRNGYIGLLDARSFEDLGPRAGPLGTIVAFRDRCAERVESFGGDAAGLLAGVALGNRTLFAGSELEQDFRTCGLAHLMAVSGTHLAVVTALVTWLLARTRLGRRTRFLVTVACLGCYVALTCFTPSAIRSFTMCAVLLASGLFSRRGSALTGLSLCAMAMLALQPTMAFSAGFALSVLSVLGLALLSPLVGSWMRKMLPERLDALADALSASASAMLLTLPVTVPMFSQLPLIAPVATLLAAPLVTLMLGLAIPGLLLGEVLLPVSSLLASVAAAIANALAALVHALADVPLACIPLDTTQSAGVLGVVLAAAAVALWATWPLPAGGVDVRMSRGRLALAVCALVAPPVCACVLGFGALSPQVPVVGALSQTAQVVMIDVGQGDCMLIRDGDAAALVDTGEEGQVLERGLARQGIAHLDAVLITHKDADHCGALSALAGVVGVDHVLVHADLLREPFMSSVLQAADWVTAGRGAQGVRPGSTLSIGRFTLTVLAPERGGESENDDSLVCLLEFDSDGDGDPEARGFLTGDAEAEATSAVVDDVGDVDFLKVAHHGSTGGMTDAELATLNPELALIGVGVDNDYGHPTAQTLQQLADIHAKVYRTDLNGDCMVGFDEDSMSVRVQRSTAQTRGG